MNDIFPVIAYHFFLHNSCPFKLSLTQYFGGLFTHSGG
jgi:hypothetical protein